MRPVSCRTLNFVYSVLLLAVVFLSWGFVIYACTVASQWMLEKKYPGVIFSFWG
ncbi:small integral membrane protein 27 [Trichosurus vulpecula]|uniref:small integral membrane protein 27 n=1 Tax=Trichosurus vulpecula TaxID=9337 RepID=UPI00186AF438|nr:small integral membrane protein 27 [Trichosurus vulpecula]